MTTDTNKTMEKTETKKTSGQAQRAVKPEGNVSANKNRPDNRGKRSTRGDGNSSSPNRRRKRRGKRPERKRSEFDHKIVSIRRVTRVMAGGRRFSFSVGVVAGDKKGRVGVGVGKAGDTALAIEKALRNAEKNMFRISLTKDGSIPHNVDAKYASSRVLLMPAPERGVIAGSSVRTVLELAGIKDVGAKIFSRSKNKINNARVAIKALKQLSAVAKK